jgi:hypothetical protein
MRMQRPHLVRHCLGTGWKSPLLLFVGTPDGFKALREKKGKGLAPSGEGFPRYLCVDQPSPLLQVIVQGAISSIWGVELVAELGCGSHRKIQRCCGWRPRWQASLACQQAQSQWICLIEPSQQQVYFSKRCQECTPCHLGSSLSRRPL